MEVTVLGSRALRHAATIMANFRSMLGTVDKEAAKSTLDRAASTKQDFAMALERTDKGIKRSSGNRFNDVMSDAADLVGDVIECIKYGFKEGVRRVLQAHGVVLRPAIKVFNKAISVVIDEVSALMSTVNDLIKKLTGKDLSDIFGFCFNVAKIKQTQNVSTLMLRPATT